MLNPNNKKINQIRHSLAHLLAMAVLELHPKAKLGIGPVINNGFFYDFDLPEKISDNDLPQLEKIMKQLIKKNLSFDKKIISSDQAKKIFKDRPYKLRLIEKGFGENNKGEIVKTKKENISIYQTDNFTDLCRGPHIKNTKEINPDTFKLERVAGAYWLGDEKNPQMQRIYGIAFNNQEKLNQYLRQKEEAKKRDHRILGQELDLFTFSELVGPGLPLWTPKGTLLRNLLDDFVWRLRKEKGYQKVEIPHIAKKDLFETSGHWEKFQEELFKIKSREGHIFVLKPMNCPFHTQIYNHKPRSYRDLPQRYANTTMVYRDEQTGELSGLSRVRSITQDDAHVFCRDSQKKEEISKIWDIIDKFYNAFDLSLDVRLSLQDPRQPKKYLGSEKIWKESEKILRDLAKEREIKAEEVLGEAAFYGPKIDFIAKDSLQREWQVATIQLDMNLPERFDLFCINEQGNKERVIMIHAAIMGAIERFIAILIEHFAGHLPVWLAPTQVVILPIAKEQLNYAEQILEQFQKNNIRAELSLPENTLGKRIMEAEKQKIPVMAIIGDKEKIAKKITIRFKDKGLKKEIFVNFEQLIKLFNWHLPI